MLLFYFLNRQIKTSELWRICKRGVSELWLISILSVKILFTNFLAMRIPYYKESDRMYDSDITSKHPLKQFKAWFEEAVSCPDLYEANAMVLSTVSRYLGH